MRLRLVPALIAALAAVPAAAAERSFPTGAFNRISNTTPFDVFVHTGKAPSAHATGTDDALNRLRIENRGGELRIGAKSGGWFSWHWGKGERARIDVNVPMLTAANVAGPGNLDVDIVRTHAFSANLAGPGNIHLPNVEAATLDLNLSGPGDLAIAGRAGQATMTLSGPGDIHVGNLMLGGARVSLSGPGDIDANVAHTADVQLSGPGDVRIRGGARCSIHKSGPGDVTCG